MNKKQIRLIETIKAQRPGVPVLLADLRKSVPMSKKAFDDAMIDLADSGKYFLSRNAKPPGSLTDSEQKAMVPDGAGRFFDTISIRSREQETFPEPETHKAVMAEISAPKPGRGGSRAGAGRPAVKTKVKRVPLAGARIPGWLMDRLKADGKMGAKIEAALIAQYGWTPPD